MGVKREVRIFQGEAQEVQNQLNIFLGCEWVQKEVSVSLQMTKEDYGIVTVLAVLTWPWQAPWEKPNG